MTLEEWNDVINTNLHGVFYVTKLALNLMPERGRIINISSITVPIAPVGSAVYSASKAAVEQFSKVLAKEVAAEGIGVNTVGLSYVAGSGMINDVDEAIMSKVLEQTNTKNKIEVKDVITAIDSLISEKSIITGQTIYVGYK